MMWRECSTIGELNHVTDTECFYPAALMFGGRHKTTNEGAKYVAVY